jgi:hypothetical protein
MLPSYTSILAAVCMIGLFAILVWILLKCVSVVNQKRMEKRVLKAMKKRRNTNDKFRVNNGYSWDYVMAFPVFADDYDISTEQRTFNTKRILSQLASGGLQVRLFYNTLHNTLYCKIRASQMRLMKEAVRSGLRLQLDENKLKTYCETGRDDKGWGPLVIPEKSAMTSIAPFKYLSAPYLMNSDGTGTHPVLKDLYRRWPSRQMAKMEGTVTPLHESDDATESSEKSMNAAKSLDISGGYITQADGDISVFESSNSDSGSQDGFEIINHSSLFRGVDRLKLINSIINDKTIGGCHLNTDALIRDKCIIDYAFLHDSITLKEIEFKWIHLFQLPSSQNVEVVKDYFGERIGLYFSWLGHYTSWLMFASIAGLGAWVFVQAQDGNPNAPVMPYFAAFMAIWGTIFLESWKRAEVRYAMEWGMSNYVENEQDRPEFTGLKSISPVTGEEATYFPERIRNKRMAYSYFVIFCSISLIIACLALLFFIREAMENDTNVAGISAEISSVLIAIQIEILNAIFGKVAIALNQSENHRTDTAFENALIGKTFVFQFINSFMSLFYIAFMKPFFSADRCLPRNCFYELQATLGTLFMSRLFISSWYKLIIPMYKQRNAIHEVKLINVNNIKDAAEAARNKEEIPLTTEQANEHLDKTDVSEVEIMFLLEEYDSLMGTFNDYASMISQYGYMTMFVSAFPLCTILALANNYVQMRVDAWRLCQVTQRPDPKSTDSIGKWQDVLEIIGLISVFTNSGLISFTGLFVVTYQWPMRVWIFFLMSCAILTVKWMFATIIPDIPGDVRIQQERNAHVLHKIIDNRKDVPDAMDASTLRVRPNFKIKIGDDDPL